MLALIRTLWQICLLEKSPADLPYSPTLALGLAIANILFGLLGLLGRPDFLPLVSEALLLVLITAGYVWLALRLMQQQVRFVQTFSALLGTGLMLAALVMGVILLAVLSHNTLGGTVANTFIQSSAMVLVLLGYLWALCVGGHVFKSALEINLALGIMVALVLELINLGVITLI